MTPYFQTDDGVVVLYCGDALEILPTLEAGSVDAIITDPPYGTRDGRGKVTKRGNKLVEFNVGKWDEFLPLEWIKTAMVNLKAGCWYAVFTDKLSVKTIWDEFEKYGGRGKQTFYWIKQNPPPQPRKNFASGVETAVLGTNGSVKKWNGGGWYLNYAHAPLVTNGRTEHPTQKPVLVMGYLIEAITEPGDLILDPFAGSGTTAVAAVRLGRRFVGVEISPEYCAIATERIVAALQQPRLFSTETPERAPEQGGLW